MTKKKAQKIVDMLIITINKMGTRESIHPVQSMFKSPRAKRSDLMNKKKQLIKQYSL